MIDLILFRIIDFFGDSKFPLQFSKPNLETTSY